MASHTAKGLIHSCDKCYYFFTHALSGFHHDLSEANGIFLFLHEGPGARLDVEDQCVNAFGKFLAHDRRADESNILDGGSNVAKRVDFLVGRSNLRVVPDQAHAAFAQDAAKLVQRQIHVEARNRFQLVERAASVAEAAPADHRNREAARRYDGSKNERSFIANPSGRVLVHFLAGDLGMVEDFSGVKHHLGESREFGAAHAANPHGHEPCSHLVIGYFAARVAGNEKIDFFAGEFSGITFFADQVDGAHAFWKANGERNTRCTGRQRDAHAMHTLEIGKSLQRLLHIRRQNG